VTGEKPFLRRKTCTWRVDGVRFVAALPLVTRAKGRVIGCLDVPGNEWSSAGQLLLDPSSDLDAVCDVMVEALGRLRTAALWFASIAIESARWQRLMRAALRAGWSVDVRHRYEVGYVALQPNWPAQLRSLPPGIRKQMTRALRRLQEEGPVDLRVVRPQSEEEGLHWIASGWALEQAGWKGLARTSVLANPRARDYVREQARELMLRDQLVLTLLEHRGHVLAFEYGWLAKQVYHSYKVSYNERFARSSPGQLLVYHLLESFSEASHVRGMDFLGPLDRAVQRWHPQRYWMGRMLLAPPRHLARALVWGARWFPVGGGVPTGEPVFPTV
jgi:CelD/BcsL family acetyltransferase involved in cellulose biosynthesis